MLTPRLTAWATLPRDRRDTLFLLLVVAGLCTPHLAYLPGWTSTLVIAVLLWRTGLVFTQRALPGRGWLLALVLLTLLATYLTHRTLLGRDAGITLLLALLALKTLELRARRDATVVFFLGFFTLLTLFLQSQGPLMGLVMLAGLWALLTALVNSHRPVGQPPLWSSARTALQLVLRGSPLVLLLFLFFPRLPPLWSTASDTPTGRSGLSATVQVGQVARLALDDSIALRARFAGPPPQAAELYWRGPVLTHFDGREWQAQSLQPSPRPGGPLRVDVKAPALSYDVTLEPQRQPWLLTLEATPTAPELPGHRVFMRDDLQWQTRQPLPGVTRYRIQSHVHFRYGTQLTPAQLAPALALPPDLNPRTRALAAQLRQDHADPSSPAQARAIIDAALTRLRQGGYEYTLEPGVFGLHTADEFWFDRRQGFCEHIASSFVILLRAAGVPARLITGYQGGERSALEQDWVVRHSDAHAWTEAWLAGQGWVRIDPTAAVAPGRVGALQRLLTPRGMFASAMEAVSPGLLWRLRTVWESATFRWNQWVLNYTAARQFDLLRQLGWPAPSRQDLLQLLAGGLALLSLFGLAVVVWRRPRTDPWLRLLARTRQRLRRAGLPLPAQATPRGMAHALAQHMTPQKSSLPASRRLRLSDNQAQALIAWLQQLEQQRYARADERQRHHELRRLAQAAKRMDWPA